MSVIEALMGIKPIDEPMGNLADQLIKRYMMAEAEKDLAEKGMDYVFGSDKADATEHALDIAIKKKQLGLDPGLDQFDQHSSLKSLAPYAAMAAAGSLVRSPLLSKGISSIFGGEASSQALTPILKEAFHVGSSGPNIPSTIADLLRRRTG